jgi:hypothetical protein
VNSGEKGGRRRAWFWGVVDSRKGRASFLGEGKLRNRSLMFVFRALGNGEKCGKRRRLFRRGQELAGCTLISFSD